MRIIELLTEAAGGMWDRMHERRMGKAITFSKDGETLDLLDVQVFPQDPKKSSYKDQTGSTVNPISTSTSSIIQQNVNVPAQGSEEPTDTTLSEHNHQSNHTQEMLDDVRRWIQSQGASIDYAVKPSNSDAASIVVILGNDTKKIALVKWSRKKSDTMPPIFWQTSVFERETGWVMGQVGKSATAKAASIRIDPSDLLTAEIKYSIDDIPNIVANSIAERDQGFPVELKTGIPKLLLDIANNPTPVPTPGLDQYQRELEVVLGETAAPIALSKGHRVSGSWNEVELQLLSPSGLSWADFTQVSYGRRGGMIEDCTMFAGDFALMVSSKDSTGGSPASLTGFVETLDKRPGEFGVETNFYKNNSEILKIIRILYDNTASDGVIKASVALNIINNDEAEYIKNILGKGTGSMEEAENYPNLPEVLKAKKLIGQNVVNKFGKTVVSKKGVDLNNHKYQLGYHLLGNLAVLIKKKLNSDVPKITRMFKSVLNRSDMVQVYTKVEKNNQGIWYDNFNVVWPPTFRGSIQIESDHYTANAKPSKKISFIFK